MSDYQQLTQHPITKKIEQAEWLDDFFGRHVYGVRFPDGLIFKTTDFEWTKDPATENRVIKGLVNDTFTVCQVNEDGKMITTEHHKDGAKSVNIQVNRLDVEAEDPGTKKAKDFIEGKVFPAIANQPVTVIVIHKPTNDYVSQETTLGRIREFAEIAVKKHAEVSDITQVDTSQYSIVEHYVADKTVKVTSL